MDDQTTTQMETEQAEAVRDPAEIRDQRRRIAREALARWDSARGLEELDRMVLLDLACCAKWLLEELS